MPFPLRSAESVWVVSFGSTAATVASAVGVAEAAINVGVRGFAQANQLDDRRHSHEHGMYDGRVDLPLLRSPRRAHIDTAGKWRELALPGRWGRGKALTELAERWTTSSLPEVDALLETQAATRHFVPGEGRVGGTDIDLLVEGQADGGRTMLGVLPLGDEPLGLTIAEELVRSRSNDRLRGGEAPAERMAREVFAIESSVIEELRFRLLSVNATLLAEAQRAGCAQAVLLVHEFRSPLTPRQIVADQRGDVELYLGKLSHRQARGGVGWLDGPLPCGSRLKLYMGRALVER